MTKSQRTLWLSANSRTVFLVTLFVLVDLYRSSSGTLECDDGLRQTIDIRDFVTEYSAYAVEFDASLGDKARFAGKLDPVQVQTLTEVAPQANEFLKYLVAGFNSCAITKERYGNFGSRFQAMDGLARQIDTLSRQEALDEDGKTNPASSAPGTNPRRACIHDRRRCL